MALSKDIEVSTSAKSVDENATKVKSIVNLLKSIQHSPGYLPHKWLPNVPHHFGAHRVEVLESGEKKRIIEVLVRLNQYDTSTLLQGFSQYCTEMNSKIGYSPDSDSVLANEDGEWSLYLANRYIFNVPSGYIALDGALKDYGGYLNYDVLRDSRGDTIRPVKAEFLWPLEVDSRGRPDVVDIPVQVEFIVYSWRKEFDAFNKRFGRRPHASER